MPKKMDLDTSILAHPSFQVRPPQRTTLYERGQTRNKTTDDLSWLIVMCPYTICLSEKN